MDNQVDLRELLKSWPYDPEDDVRLVPGNDGRQVLQVRLPLGIEQYELDGRPDGDRPYDKESALEYQLERLSQAEKSQTASEFKLNSDECAELFNEGTLYYYRYLHLFQAKDWQRTVRDTSRNLRLFELIRRYAEDEDDQLYLEQWRPYVIRMNGAAAAMLHLEEGNYGPALELLNQAIAAIEALDDLDNETFQFERERSLAALKDMIGQIEENKPVTELELLERELRQAIESQHFERAADLRDRIRALRTGGK
jgi:hypothetical protein